MIAGRQWAKAAGLDLHEFSVSADQVNHEPVDGHLQPVTGRRQHRLDCSVQRALAQHADARHAPEARGGIGALPPPIGALAGQALRTPPWATRYDVLNRAFREVMNGAELIALQKNRYWLRADGLSLDVGPFVAAIEFATGREAYVVGKPARGFFEQVLGDLGVDAQEAAMVGDDIESDIRGALRAGLGAILVRTGKYREDRVRESGIEATVVVGSIADVPALFGCWPA